VRVDRDKAALLGLTVGGVANGWSRPTCRARRPPFCERGNEYPSSCGCARATAATSPTSTDILVSTPAGVTVPAKNVARSVRPEAGPVQIERKNQERIYAASTPSRGDAQPGGGRRRAGSLAGVERAAGLRGRLRREVEEQAKAPPAAARLILAIVLVYMIMASQYESLRDPFVIMFSIPLGAIGVVLVTLWATGTTFSMQSLPSA
jgi:hydrophobic/amphiphilic exporter-1 (mainly G- bacteria), HAE1 family